VNERISTLILLNETKTFLLIEPLDCTLHGICTFLFGFFVGIPFWRESLSEEEGEYRGDMLQTSILLSTTFSV
jgi:hypothetical protein